VISSLGSSCKQARRHCPRVCFVIGRISHQTLGGVVPGQRIVDICYILGDRRLRMLRASSSRLGGQPIMLARAIPLVSRSSPLRYNSRGSLVENNSNGRRWFFSQLLNKPPPSREQPPMDDVPPEPGQQVVKFRDLQQFIRTKEAIDDGHVRQMILTQQYRPLRYLGRGRFGKVFLCEDPDHKLCAIKVLNVERDRKEYNWTWLTAEERKQSQSDAQKLRVFIDSLDSGLVKDHMLRAEEMLLDTMRREENPLLRKVRRPVAEREILLRIGAHPFVANLLSSFRDSRFMCLVFDYFPAGNLQKLISREQRMSEDLARFFASQLLLALMFLQSKNVAHRDVKPSNILLSKDGFIALADFGLATRLRGGLKTFCGTAEYIAPEVLSEKMWSAAGLDMWAFGICLYQMLVGKTPFEAPDATSVFLNTLTSPVKFPDFVSPVAQDLLTGILMKDSTKRSTGEQVKRHAFFKDVNWEALGKCDPSVIPSELAKKIKLNPWDDKHEPILDPHHPHAHAHTHGHHHHHAHSQQHIKHFDSLLKGN